MVTIVIVGDSHLFQCASGSGIQVSADLDPDPIPDPDIGISWLKIVNKIFFNKISFFWSKIAIDLYLGLQIGPQSYKRSLQPLEDKIQYLKHEIRSLFVTLSPPWSRSTTHATAMFSSFRHGMQVNLNILLHSVSLAFTRLFSYQYKIDFHLLFCTIHTISMLIPDPIVVGLGLAQEGRGSASLPCGGKSLPRSILLFNLRIKIIIRAKKT